MSVAIEQDKDYDEFCRQCLHDPYPFFARLREEDPVHWCEPLHMWLVTRYDDVYQGLRDKTRLSTNREAMYTGPLLPENLPRARPMIDHINKWLLNVDQPDHTRMRKLVNHAFTPRLVARLVPRIEALVEKLLDGAARSGQVDFIECFCLPLPTLVICDMLGIPEERQAQYRRCVEGLIPFSSAGGSGLNDKVEQARACLDELIEFFDELIAQRREDPREDLVSAMAAAEVDGECLDRNELFGLCVFLFLAGLETTMGLLANGTLALLQNPEQFRLLRADPEGLAEKAVEEFVRYDSPGTRGVRRALVDFEWRGSRIRAGQTVTNLIGAANRDPEQFPDPDTLDITRHPTAHVGFGRGIHFCLGAPLARLEGQIAFRAMMRRLPNMELVTDRVSYKPVIGIRALETLPVRLG